MAAVGKLPQELDLVRFVMASTQGGPEVAEYPDLRQITAQARTGSQTGDRLWFIYDVPDREQ